ncbi:thiamine phosphate synthase [Gordonia sp. NPDC003429]
MLPAPTLDVVTGGKRQRLDAATLYLCTDARRERGDLLDFVDAVLAAGVDIVQLRDKGSVGEQRFGALEARHELEILAGLRQLTSAHDALLAVNDRTDIAALAGADVLHVGQDDLAPADARTIVGPDVLIGRSTHDIDQATHAATDTDVDYFCVGPCWPTPTKPGRPAPGLDLVRQVAAAPVAAAKPWFAIGGIDTGRLAQVRSAGARRAVVVRAITAAPDPATATRQLRAHLLG